MQSENTSLPPASPDDTQEITAPVANDQNQNASEDASSGAEKSAAAEPAPVAGDAAAPESEAPASAVAADESVAESVAVAAAVSEPVALPIAVGARVRIVKNDMGVYGTFGQVTAHDGACYLVKLESPCMGGAIVRYPAGEVEAA